jgi:hypothetical protein
MGDHVNEAIERLDDYVSCVLGEGEAASFEEELFELAARGDDEALHFLDSTTEELSFLASKKQFGESHTRAEIEQLRAENAHAHYIDMGSGGVVTVPIWPDATNRVIFHFKVDLRGYEHVEVESVRPDGTPVITFRDVRCDPSNGNIYGVCFESLARMAFVHGPVVARISGLRDGERKLVTEVETRPLPA